MNQNNRAMTKLTLVTDSCQLTMGQLYIRMGMVGVQAQFDHGVRSYPNHGGHPTGCRINACLEWPTDWHIPTRALTRCALAGRRICLSWIRVSNAS